MEAKGRPNRRVTAKLAPEVRGPRSTLGVALRIVKWSAIVGLAMTAIAASGLALAFWWYGRDPHLPRIESLADYRPRQVVRVVTADGRVIDEIFTERRTFLPYDKVPKLVIDAFVAAEDAKFFHHEGIDYVGMLRALIANLRAGHTRQGASTITQQVVKTFLLSPERTFKRKIQEIILARRLENALSKEDILTLYLNQIYFGHGRYGIEEAARFYFGKSVRELDVGEAAMLAGLPQAPENLSPKKPQNRERAKGRQQYVLEQMAYRGYIDEATARKYINAPIRVVDDAYPDIGSAPEWLEVARRELVASAGADAVDTLGGTVVVTMDPEVQAAARKALQDGLRAVDQRQKWGRPVDKVKPDKIALMVAKLARKLPHDGPAAGQVYDAVVLAVHDADRELVVDLGDWKAAVELEGPLEARYNPDGKKPSERFAVGDVIRVERLGTEASAAATPVHAERAVGLAVGPEGAVVVIDPETRQVLAMVGGFSTRGGDFNRAMQGRRQPGSSFKPFVYAAALDSGQFTPATVVNDAPEVYDLWKPENYKKGHFEGPVRLRSALARSINTVAIRVIHDVGPDKVAALAHAMGIESTLPAQLSLALGSGEVSPLELTNAFTTLAAGGWAAPPRLVTSIAGKELPVAERKQAVRPEVAYVVVDMMRSVVEEGTATAAKELKMVIAGKTGTSNDARDAWFIGMTPSLVVGVWIGFDAPRPLGSGETGGKAAVPVFVNLIKSLGRRVRSKPFPRPAGVVEARIDKKTGLLAAPGAPDAQSMVEVFIDGTEPTETAPSAGEVDPSTFVVEQYDEEAGAGAGDSGAAPTP